MIFGNRSPVLWALIALALATSIFASPAISDDETEWSSSVRALMEKEKLQRLKGWKRIAFLCSPPEKVKATAKEFFERICERTNTNVKFLAATANAQLSVASSGFGLGALTYREGRLKLEVDLFQVGCDASASFCAVHADVTASFSYDKAIDQAARLYPLNDQSQRPKDSPASVPRPIQAVMWGPAHSTGSGPVGEELSSAIANGIDTILKTFFTDYVQANRGE